MFKCPNCLGDLPVSTPPTECPKCGKAYGGPTPANSALISEADIAGTVDIETPMDPSTAKATDARVNEFSDSQWTESSKTATFSDTEVDGTLDLETVFAPDTTGTEVTQDVPLPQQVEPSSPSKSESDVTIDEDLLARLADSTSIGATLAPVSDPTNINPLSTIAIGASDITVNRSRTPGSQVKGTDGKGGKQTGDGGKTAGSTSSGAADSSLDFNRSILSTISKRTLSEKTDPFGSAPDYEIVSKLGEGGMGVVYSAIQKTLDRQVAIKAIKSGKTTSDESRRKFFFEAQITSDLGHPNIVPIHEMGSNDDGTLFYSMKIVNGSPWEDAILDKDRQENIEIFMKVCDAVAFAHSRNIIHRDLKPENVMLGAFGEVLVMDWGLAVNMNTNHSFGLSGTPVYMAPEMARHDVSKIGKASDIYLLGAILFQIIVGKAPHKGKSVRECMANAMQNINIEPGFEDPFLDIANHAMATEPKDRYESVIEFQDAIREHMRHAQSIALCRRAEELLENSIHNNDYQGFAKALFSMEDAIELWPENHVATDGLHRTRLAYGQCALDRSDYDLCLQTLDTRFEDEAALHSLATERKASVVQQRKRFKLLKNVLAAVILFAIGSLTIATLYARRQAQIAQEQETLARLSAESEKAARVNEEEAKQVAIEQRNLAQQSAEDEKAARKNEEEAKELAVAAREQAVASEQKAKQSEKEAVRNARLALLGNYQSELNLALNQTNQFDITRSNLLLQQIKTIEKNVGVGNNEPILQNWAFHRIELLNNHDLSRVNVDSNITAFQYAPVSERGIIGTLSGQVSIVDLANGKLSPMPDRTLKFQDPIHAVAISSDGEEAIIAIGSQRSEYSVYRWRTSSRDAVPVRSLGKRYLQRLSISPDGAWAIGGINAGLWKWERNAKGFETDPFRLDCRGSLVSLQWIDKNANDVFGLSKMPNGNSVCIRANLKTNVVQTYLMPESIVNQVSTVAMSLDQQSIYIGLNDGSLLVASVGKATARAVSMQQNSRPQSPATMSTLAIESEIQPKKHSTAVRGIEVHSDGTVLTFSDEPVVHVWRREPNSNGLTYTSYLVGLAGNVTNAKFLKGSENVAATDDIGNMLQWNILDQEHRRMLSQSVPSKLLSQSLSLDGTLQSIDIEGVLRIILPEGNTEPTALAAEKSAVESFIGHTSGARVTDLAIASSEPLIATVASLVTVPASEFASEVCVWNSSARTMLHRLKYKTTGACRIAFVNRDKGLVISDGKESIMIPLISPEKSAVENRFGTRLVATHPKQSSLAALIATSGSVRLVDWQNPSKWEDEGYRYFDIAINNRFEPIEAAWAEDGKRLFILFEHGRIARLEWDGASLANLSWSDELPVIRSVEQETPWRYFDFALKALSNNSDQLVIVVRSSESKSTGIPLQLNWSRAESRLRMPNETSAAVSPLPIETLRPNLHDVARASQESVFHDAMIAVDRQGTITITQQDKPTFSLGRPSCVSVSNSNDGKRWSTVHVGGMVLLATLGGHMATWHQVDHPFVEVLQSELSADGLQLAVVGRLPSGASKAAVYNVTGPGALTPAKSGELDNALFLRWHPRDNAFVILDGDKNWHRVDNEGKRNEIKSETWDRLKQDQSSRFVSMKWLCEPTGKTGKPLWHMVMLSQTQDASRIDFVSENTETIDQFQPIVSNSTITSFALAPRENVLAVGDGNGTLGIWFVAPSLDESPRELFTLPGHRGAIVSQLSFSSDGSTILSSDTSHRAIQWRSR